MIRKFNHIGVLVSDIYSAMKIYAELGYSFSEIVRDPIQQVDIVFASMVESPVIELISPTINSKLCNLLGRNGSGPYHVCYETKNINSDISFFKKLKFILVSNPVEAIAFNGRKICFLYNKDIGLVELVES